MAVNKIDPKTIFASEAPTQDTPAVFTNKTVGWGESRKNGGRPTIKQMNALQQETDLKILWLNENAVTPYDATIDYPNNAVTIKDGTFKIFNGTSWSNFLDKSSVGLGNIDNTSDLSKPISTSTQTALNLKADKSYVDSEFDYIHENGAALPYKDGVVYEENAVVVKDGELQQWKGGVWVNLNTASQIADASGKTQQEINDNVLAKTYSLTDAGGVGGEADDTSALLNAVANNSSVLLDTDTSVINQAILTKGVHLHGDSTLQQNTQNKHTIVVGSQAQDVAKERVSGFKVSGVKFGEMPTAISDDYAALFFMSSDGATSSFNTYENTETGISASVGSFGYSKKRSWCDRFIEHW